VNTGDGWDFIVLQSEGPPSLVDAAAQLGISINDLDSSFDVQPLTPPAFAKQLGISVDEMISALGVIPLDLKDELYGLQVRNCVQVLETAKSFRGRFSNPAIAHLALAKTSSDSSSGATKP
jgi:hypothetical protein